MSLGCPWVINGLLVGCSWGVTGLLLVYQWVVTGMSLGCHWVVTGLLLECPVDVPGLSPGFYWDVSGVSLGCCWDVHGCRWVITGLLLGCHRNFRYTWDTLCCIWVTSRYPPDCTRVAIGLPLRCYRINRLNFIVIAKSLLLHFHWLAVDVPLGCQRVAIGLLLECTSDPLSCDYGTQLPLGYHWMLLFEQWVVSALLTALCDSMHHLSFASRLLCRFLHGYTGFCYGLTPKKMMIWNCILSATWWKEFQIPSTRLLFLFSSIFPAASFHWIAPRWVVTGLIIGCVDANSNPLANDLQVTINWYFYFQLTPSIFFLRQD